MHPILFVLELGAGERPIATFGVMLALGMILGAIVGVRACVRAGIDGGDAIAAAAILASAGLFGGYALQIVVETFRGAALDDAARAGGLTFYGAPILGTLALFGASRLLGFPFTRFVDAAIPAIPLAHAMGRIGCFFGGCCYGRAWDGPCAVTFTHPFAAASIEPIARHPVQLYEAGMLLLLALAFVAVPASRVGDGRRAVAYAGAYAVVRLVAERFRGDAERGFVAAGVSTSDAISIVVLALAAAFLLRRRAA